VGEALTSENELLGLARSDMLQAGAAARLVRRQMPIHARLALETAVAVCYARPWGNNNVGRLHEKWLPEADADRKLHARLLMLRDKRYAHTDPEGGREALAQADGAVGEQWIVQLRPAELDAIADLCDRQADRFKQALAV
jgi:hypothetical protein